VLNILNKELTWNVVQTWKNPSHGFKMLNQVYGEEVMSRALTTEWCKQFSEGRNRV
jgi:hypothetical protein